ncbi:MAG: hypothetical protein NC408_08375 [Candidatus Gastranaerophilales bacterium]|nr:hypothetical protein [Candidatus Gastranaerophilales bacterium]MCM1072324.1 NADH-quinone oxidoreductase subunit E [Bacteroides sp.]
MEYFILSIEILLFGALAALLVKEKFKLKVCSIFTIFASLTALYPAGYVLFTGNVLSGTFNPTPLFGEIVCAMDPLSAVFTAVISVMSLLGVIYANGYMKPYLNKGMHTSSHCFFLMLLIASMLGVVTVQNGLFFLIVWELMSLSSFFLVIFEGEKKDVLKAGIKYLVYMHFSVIFIIAMIAMLANASGSFGFGAFAEAVSNNPQLANAAFLLAFVGFGIKAGFVPFHNWLPDAHPAAPTHVSGIMSGVMIKTGIYGILRTLLIIGVPSKFVSYVVLVVAVVSALYGVLYAITQHDIKRLLAYHSIENIGIIGIGIAVGMLGLAYGNNIVAVLGFSGAILHVVNHSIFKELLFFAAGSTYLKTHTRNIETLGGLIKKMPYTALLFIVGSVAICGLPPFNGFISEFLIYAGMLHGIPSSEMGMFITLVISIGALAMVGTMAVLCFSKASGIMFLGEARSEAAAEVKEDVSAVMIIPMSILGLFTLLIGVLPQYVLKFIFPPVAQFAGSQDVVLPIFESLISVMQQLSICLGIFLVMLVVFFVLRALINKRYEEHCTWGCGYNRANPHMQYTASSYASPFISTLKPLFKRVSHIKKPKDLFPKEAYYELEIEDIEEAYIVNPIVKWDEKILAKFERIQNGNMQQYILFGLIFLVLAIVGLVIWG